MGGTSNGLANGLAIRKDEKLSLVAVELVLIAEVFLCFFMTSTWLFGAVESHISIIKPIL